MIKVLLIFLISSSAFAQVPWTEFAAEESTPAWIHYLFNDLNLKKEYKFSYHLNPFYLRGDFNGDGKLDIAILVRNIRTNKIGIAICHYGENKIIILGAGTKYNKSSDNFSWMDVWCVGEGNDKKEIIAIRRSEAGGGTLKWNGKKYIWTPYENE